MRDTTSFPAKSVPARSSRWFSDSCIDIIVDFILVFLFFCWSLVLFQALSDVPAFFSEATSARALLGCPRAGGCPVYDALHDPLQDRCEPKQVEGDIELPVFQHGRQLAACALTILANVLLLAWNTELGNVKPRYAAEFARFDVPREAVIGKVGQPCTASISRCCCSATGIVPTYSSCTSSKIDSRRSMRIGQRHVLGQFDLRDGAAMHLIGAVGQSQRALYGLHHGQWYDTR